MLKTLKYRANTIWQSIMRTHRGTLWRTTPISRVFGFNRGTPIDRYYIETFLKRNQSDIKGHVLEVGDSEYTKKFGSSKVIKTDILHVVAGEQGVTIVGDLSSGIGIPENTFDCMILTQTFQFIYDIKSAIRYSYQALAPGGILLATFSGISQISRFDMDRWGEYWRLTTLSTQKLFEETFPKECIQIESYGNVLTSIAFLHGLATEELTLEELDYHDNDYQMIISVRGIKP